MKVLRFIIIIMMVVLVVFLSVNLWFVMLEISMSIIMDRISLSGCSNSLISIMELSIYSSVLMF